MKTVIEMARESNLMDSRDDWGTVPIEYEVAINAFAELVRANEREAMLHLAISHGAPWSFQESIRARSST